MRNLLPNGGVERSGNALEGHFPKVQKIQYNIKQDCTGLLRCADPILDHCLVLLTLDMVVFMVSVESRRAYDSMPSGSLIG